MTGKHLHSKTGPTDETGRASRRRSATPAERKGGMRLSMHDGVAVWCDCCSCEAEPYWIAEAVEAETGLGLHEDTEIHSPHKK